MIYLYLCTGMIILLVLQEIALRILNLEVEKQVKALLELSR